MSKRPVQPPRGVNPSPEDEISRLFALMMPERAAKSPRPVTAAVIPQGVNPSSVPREMAGRVEAECERAAVAVARGAHALIDEQERAALLAAIAADRARRRRLEIAWHTALIVAFLVIVLPVLGVWAAKLLLPLALAR